MNIITIEFAHLTAEQPTYTFGARVAVAGNCSPELWPSGKVIGLLLDEDLVPTWFYVVQLDSPSGLVEEYPSEDLVPESFIPTRKAEWDLGEAAWIKAHQEPDEECASCDGSGHRVDDYTFQSYSCTSCAGYN